ncbi:MAG: hypothetical protein Q7S34_03120 [bacterium]|nr:hypothetical protein [bacterium]
MQKQHATIEVKVAPKVEPKRIIVTGEREYKFAWYHWRQAVRQYLTCIWTNHFSFQETVDLTLPTGELMCGYSSDFIPSVYLRYLAVNRKYEAFGSFDKSYPPTFQHIRRESVLQVSVTQPEQLETALARFAWNQQIRALGITFLNNPSHIKKLWLWGQRGIRVYEEPRDGWCL